jgi:hypothetical protein
MKRIHVAALLTGTLAATLAYGHGAAAEEMHGVGFVLVSALEANGKKFCMDASLDAKAETKTWGEVYIYECHGRENQRWSLTDGADGTSAIIGHRGMCLDVRGRQKKDGTPIQLWKCHYQANQRFVAVSDAKDRSLFRIKETSNRGSCLTVGPQAGDRKPVFLDECDEQTKQQTWRIAHSW